MAPFFTGVNTRLLYMLVLCGDGAHMAFPIVCFLLRRWPLVDAAIAAIIADAVSRVVFDPGVIGVMDVLVVYAIYRRVVVEMIVFPPAAFVAVTTVSESVIDPANEAAENVINMTAKSNERITTEVRIVRSSFCPLIFFAL